MMVSCALAFLLHVNGKSWKCLLGENDHEYDKPFWKLEEVVWLIVSVTLWEHLWAKKSIFCFILFYLVSISMEIMQRHTPLERYLFMWFYIDILLYSKKCNVVNWSDIPPRTFRFWPTLKCSTICFGLMHTQVV